MIPAEWPAPITKILNANTEVITTLNKNNKALLRVARAAAGVDDYLGFIILEEDWDDIWLEVPSRKPFRLLIEALKEVEHLLHDNFPSEPE